jgi:hypothetical protein
VRPLIWGLKFSRGSDSEALGALVKADAEKWRPIIKEFGIKQSR